MRQLLILFLAAPLWAANDPIVRQWATTVAIGSGARQDVCDADLGSATTNKRSIMESNESGNYEIYMYYTRVLPNGTTQIYDKNLVAGQKTCVSCGLHGSIWGTSPNNYGTNLTQVGGVRLSRTDCLTTTSQIQMPGSVSGDGSGYGVGFEVAVNQLDWTPGAFAMGPATYVSRPANNGQATLWPRFNPARTRIYWTEKTATCVGVDCELLHMPIYYRPYSEPAGVPTLGTKVGPIEPAGQWNEINDVVNRDGEDWILFASSTPGNSACYPNLYKYGVTSTTLVPLTGTGNIWAEHATCVDAGCTVLMYESTQDVAFTGPNGSGGCNTPPIFPFVMSWTGTGQKGLLERTGQNYISVALTRVQNGTASLGPIFQSTIKGAGGNGINTLALWGATTAGRGRVRLSGRTRQ